MSLKRRQTAFLLAGDVGGTKTRLGIFRYGGDVRPVRQREFASRQYDGLEGIIGNFLDAEERIASACFGVAGPVIDGVAAATNLPWTISEKSLRSKLSLDRVTVINDLVANAYGIDTLRRRDFGVLNRGRNVPGNRALLSAGTGLGAAILFRQGGRYFPSASEGGHVEFGPKNRLELGLLRYLFELYGHVSYERILSGSGIVNIYRFLKDTERCGREPGWLGKRLEGADPAAVITEAARKGTSRLCGATLELFASIYGAAAGNLALQVMATGGMYLGGGIAPKIIWKLRDGAFMNAFRNKGRLSPIVERIPVKVIKNDNAALLGAAARAAEPYKKR